LTHGLYPLGRKWSEQDFVVADGTLPTFPLEVDAPLGTTAVIVATDPHFDPDGALTEGGFVPYVPTLTLPVPAIGYHTLFVRLMNADGEAGPVEIVHLVVDDGTHCPAGQLWAVDEETEACVFP
jgi:hypothetical protein